MNKLKVENGHPPLSERLTEMFESLDQIKAVYRQIELSIEQEYQAIEKKVNPEKNNDLSRELRYNMADFLKNMAKDFGNKGNKNS